MYKELVKRYFLGVEAPLWSETISNIDGIGIFAFPRMIGYFQLSLSLKENRIGKIIK